jgi:hypothetical protein
MRWTKQKQRKEDKKKKTSRIVNRHKTAGNRITENRQRKSQNQNKKPIREKIKRKNPKNPIQMEKNKHHPRNLTSSLHHITQT